MWDVKNLYLLCQCAEVMTATPSISDIQTHPMDKTSGDPKFFIQVPEELLEVLEDSEIMAQDAECHTTESDLENLINKYGMDPKTLVRLPEEHQQLDWSSDNWASLSIDPCKWRRIIPLPGLIVDLCMFFDIAPSQLMPVVWHVVCTL